MSLGRVWEEGSGEREEEGRRGQKEGSTTERKEKERRRMMIREGRPSYQPERADGGRNNVNKVTRIKNI